MKFIEKTKGAVSIFLVIVLAPMLTVAAAFVDASKTKLARAMVNSAGDLALNTALTDYDSQLKELYGLIATAQDTEDLFSRLEDYYKTCITSSGVDAAEADFFVQEVISGLRGVAGSGDIDDIMNLNLLDFSVEKYEDGNLGNATVLKKQIVDFMKYRAPINTGLSFISSLKSFSTLSKQTDLVEKKQNYYKAQQTVMEDLQKAWESIAAYNGTKIVTDKDYLRNIENYLENDCCDIYFDCGKRTIKSLYKKYDTICSNKFYAEVEYSDKDESVWSITYDGKTYYSYLNEKYEYKNTYNEYKLPTEQDVENALSAFYSAKDNFLIKELPPYESSYYSIQFMAQKKGEITAYMSSVINFFNAYQKLRNILYWIDSYKGNSFYDSVNVTIQKTTKKASDWIEEIKRNNWFNVAKEICDLQASVSVYVKVAKDAADAYEKANTISIGRDVAVVISDVQKNVQGYINSLNEASEKLDLAIKYLNAAKEKLTVDCANAKSEWNRAASDKDITNTSMAKQDQSEINQLDTYLNEQNIQKLINRLNNIKGKIDEVISQVKRFTFADVFIGDIDSYSGDNGLEKACEKKWGDYALTNLPLDNNTLDGVAGGYSKNAWHGGDIKDDWVKQSGYQPNLMQDKCSLYTYMSSKFGAAIPSSDNSTPSTNIDTEKKETGKNKFNKIKDTAQKAADDKTDSSGQASKGSNNKGISGDDLPSKKPKTENNAKTPSGTIKTKIDGDDKGPGASGQASKSLGGLFGDGVLSAFKKLGTDLRDKLYIADYVMSMFTYDTIENEYRVKNEKDKSYKIQDGELKSLTNQSFSADNNFIYGAEVEYILFGDPKNTKNLISSYGTIFAIRFGFNLVYAFSTSEIRESALAIAAPISAATLSIIPAPLIQAVIIVGMACCESALDLASLREGNKVPLYKSKKTWQSSIVGLVKNVSKEVFKKASGYLIDVGVDKLNELLDMTSDELDALTDKAKDSIVQATEQAFNQIVTQNAEAAIQQLSTLVTTAVQDLFFLEEGEDLDHKAAQLKKDIYDNIKKWGESQSGNDLASTIKRGAAKCIGESDIDALFNNVRDSLKKDDGSILEDIIKTSTITESVDDGIDYLGGKAMEAIAAIRKKITNQVVNVSKKITDEKDKLIDSVKSSLGEGAENLKDTINNKIDGIFGSGESTDSSSGVASLCSFAYSDYLRLFTVIGLITNEEKVILRIGDVIQKNMAQKTNNEKYSLFNAAAYVKVSATVQVKPTLIVLPFFADITKNPTTDSYWYEIEYTGVAGY